MDCIKFAGTRKGEVRKTARKAYEKIFAGTEKGEVRKTARRAYVDTSSDKERSLQIYAGQIVKRLKSILMTSGAAGSKETTGEIWKLIKDLEK